MKFILMNSLKYQSIHTNVLISTNHKKENNLSGLHYIAIWSYILAMNLRDRNISWTHASCTLDLIICRLEKTLNIYAPFLIVFPLINITTR